MAKAKTIHRDGMEEYTECGIPLDKGGLLVQPADGSGDPVTCGKCIRLLTSMCYKCNVNVVCYRDKFMAPSMGGPDRDILQYLVLRCPNCNVRCEWGQRPGERKRKREKREQLASSRDHRKQKQAETHQQWKDEWNADRAEKDEFGVLVDGCAICGEPLPDNYYTSRHWDKTMPDVVRYGAPRGWVASQFRFLGWRYCPEHVGLGEEMEKSLLAAFRADAAQIRQQVSGRFAR